jgi:hypothetical protein
MFLNEDPLTSYATSGIGSRKSSYFQRPISDEPIKPLGIYQHDGFKDVYF